MKTKEQKLLDEIMELTKQIEKLNLKRSKLGDKWLKLVNQIKHPIYNLFECEK